MQKKKEINIEVGHRIQMVREKCGYTQEQFAEALDVSVQHISNIERGVTGVSLTTLKKTCEILNTSADYLLLGKGYAGESNLLTQQLHTLPTEQAILVERGISQLLQALELANQKDD
ncbi:MAG: helix-turn-helix transcriptional regulator [Eubacteriales bacterium]|nr:helix-turn-helix transcriptional regulator [Eubacteriales bacterium]